MSVTYHTRTKRFESFEDANDYLVQNMPEVHSDTIKVYHDDVLMRTWCLDGFNKMGPVSGQYQITSKFIDPHNQQQIYVNRRYTYSETFITTSPSSLV